MLACCPCCCDDGSFSQADVLGERSGSLSFDCGDIRSDLPANRIPHQRRHGRILHCHVLDVLADLHTMLLQQHDVPEKVLLLVIPPRAANALEVVFERLTGEESSWSTSTT
jgi:hypothetical protein